MTHPRRKTIAVKVGRVTVGGSAPIVVQSMTNTDTADIEGTAQQVPGSTNDRVLSACDAAYAIMELGDPTGATGTAPPLYISLPDGTTDDYCTSGGPSTRNQMQGWHKAYPLATVGEF